MVALLDSYCGSYMANTAELYGSQQGITREMQDEFALRSQKCADDAYKAGRIQEELVPVALRNHKGELTGEMLTEDDHRRPQTTMEISRFVYAQSDSQFAFVLKVVQGVVAYVSGRIAKLSPDAVRLETPSAIIGVRGTRLVIEAGP